MNQREAVIEVMRANSGYATLGHLYREALKISGVKWETKTPFKSINRIVQNSKHFFRIRPGLWALNEAKDRLPSDLRGKPKPQSDHTYYQGLLVELGNLRSYTTFVPPQDRNKLFLGKRLGDMTTVEKIYLFAYEDIVRRAQTVDVIWFDDNKMPSEFIEVENTTDLNNSLLKFTYFKPFFSVFRIVAPSARRKEFDSKVKHSVFTDLHSRIRFSSYELVSDLHSKASEIKALEQSWM
ncbi:MAG: hypothetical protein ACRDGA_08130 [Bacteroidota bacterium]